MINLTQGHIAEGFVDYSYPIKLHGKGISAKHAVALLIKQLTEEGDVTKFAIEDISCSVWPSDNGHSFWLIRVPIRKPETLW